MAAVEDNVREVEWRDLADTVLVFVCIDTPYGVYMLILFQDGLFAAFLSAFLVFLIPQLQQNSTDVAMDVLIHISQQLSNSSIPAFEPVAFQVSSNIAAVNILFFLSLALVLFDAFLAMLVKGWLQEFDRGWRTFTVAHLRAQERERRLQELERWKLHELVALLPILIQGSLLLFCIGLLALIFPLHLPSFILCTIAFVCGVGFYVFTTYVAISNHYAPFSSPVSRLLVRGLAILQPWLLPITRSTRCTAPVNPLANPPPFLPHDHQSDADTSRKTIQPLASNIGGAKAAQLHKLNSDEKSKVVPRSRSDIDPWTHIHVLERLVTTTAQAVENIPIFLELLDRPVRDATIRPMNVEKWRELLHITLGLMRDQSTFSVPAACTLTRTMMSCYNNETADQQLCHTLQLQLGSPVTDSPGSRVPLNDLFSLYLSAWLTRNVRMTEWQMIAFLEPSDATDAELLWIVNTFHSTMHYNGRREHFGFYVAVLAYVSSTEQSRRSQVPLTAAVIYAVHTIIAARDQRSSGTIDRRYILPGIVSTSESMATTFCPVDGIETLDLWSDDCIQYIRDLLQWYEDNEFQLSLIAALYIDSTKHTQARSAFEDLLQYTRITNIQSQFSNAYDHGKLAIYRYIALSQKPLDQDGQPPASVYDVIEKTISKDSTLQLHGLHIMDIAVKHVHKNISLSSDWLKKDYSWLYVIAPGQQYPSRYIRVDPWVLLHLDTLLATQLYLLPEEVQWLTWSETAENVHIAKARLDFYDSSAKAGHEEANVVKPDPRLLRVFLRSKDLEVCTRTFEWCLDLASISQPTTGGNTNSTPMFIPETMGYLWAEHFVHVLCKGDPSERVRSWNFLRSNLVPKWTMLPSSWCCDFASALLFSIVEPRDTHGLPAYQCFAQAFDESEGDFRLFVINIWLKPFIPFLGSLLELITSSLTLARLTSLEDWWSQTPEKYKDQESRTQMDQILVTTKQQLAEVTLGFFQELPMAGSWMDE